MIPHVAARGSSFKGAGLYYLHDKSARTSERVEWTLTHNVPTNDPEKALKWMTYTAMNAEKIKQEYGGSRVGRKSKDKSVYTYSLSWHKDDQPTRKEMQEAAFETLDRLELKDHEAVIVAHRDTDHPHVHIICNLVNPNTGRTHTAKLDQKKLSEWAQEHDKRFGRDHCPERIKNNQERNRGQLQQEFTRQHDRNQSQSKDGQTRKFVKHRTKADPRAVMIQDLYNRSDSGKAFRSALKEEGYDLAQGHKGRVAIVNEYGQVFSLSRQLKGQRARDIKARLKDVEFKTLPLAEERLYFDRDKYHAEQQEKIETAAIEAIKQGDTSRAGDIRTVKREFKEAAKDQDAGIFDRDAYETERQKSITDAAIRAEEKRIAEDKRQREKEKQKLVEQRERKRREQRHKAQGDNRKQIIVGEKSIINQEFNEEVYDGNLPNDVKKTEEKKDTKTSEEALLDHYDQRHLDALDKLKEWGSKAAQRRRNLETRLEDTYEYMKMTKRLEELENDREKANGFFDRLSGKRKQLETHIEEIRLDIEEADIRMQEARDALEKDLLRSKPPEFKHYNEDDRKARMEAFEKVISSQKGERNSDRSIENDRGEGPDVSR